MGGSFARRTQPCSWPLLALAQPPASWSVNFPSPRFVRRTFFRRCGCLLGPVAGAGTDHPDKRSLTRQEEMGPRRSSRSTSGPNKNQQLALTAALIHRLHRRIALANGKVMIFAIITVKRRDNRRGAVINQNIRIFHHGSSSYPGEACNTGCSRSTFQRSRSGAPGLPSLRPGCEMADTANGTRCNTSQAGSDDSRALVL